MGQEGSKGKDAVTDIAVVSSLPTLPTVSTTTGTSSSGAGTSSTLVTGTSAANVPSSETHSTAALEESAKNANGTSTDATASALPVSSNALLRPNGSTSTVQAILDEVESDLFPEPTNATARAEQPTSFINPILPTAEATKPTASTASNLILPSLTPTVPSLVSTHTHTPLSSSTQTPQPYALSKSSVSTTEGGLPPGWEIRFDPRYSRAYYVHIPSKTSQWEHPNKKPLPAENTTGEDLPKGWISRVDPRYNVVYYANLITRQSQWTKPTASAEEDTQPERKQKADKKPVQASNQANPTEESSTSTATGSSPVHSYFTMHSNEITQLEQMGFTRQTIEECLGAMMKSGNGKKADINSLLESVLVHSAQPTKPETKGAKVTESLLIPPVLPPPQEVAPQGPPTSQKVESSCIVCFQQEVNAVLLPCGHFGLCLGCAQSVKDTQGVCPVCRRPLERIVQIFRC